MHHKSLPCPPTVLSLDPAGGLAGPRNYRVDFGKLAGTFPGLALRWTVRDGIDELLSSYTKYGLIYEDFTSARFVRLRRIKELLAAGVADEMLRRPDAAVES